MRDEEERKKERKRKGGSASLSRSSLSRALSLCDVARRHSTSDITYTLRKAEHPPSSTSSPPYLPIDAILQPHHCTNTPHPFAKLYT
mmetsp:Transcript_12913/g.34922  ORF Transcript_12913/g.34922 Transcript_12913/m.34922 type:complete len:87 (-) Transcript_12913:297-557(-)